MFFSSLRRLQIGLIVASLAFCLPVQAAYARSRVSEIVVDASTGTVLFSQAPDAARRPASLTKLMTLYLAFEALADGRLRPSDPLPISRRAARQPATHLGIAAGGRITVGKALDAIAAISSNDLAVAVAERIAGSEPKFARLMTAKARQLGMRNTRFANASGLTSAGNMTRRATWRSSRAPSSGAFRGNMPGSASVRSSGDRVALPIITICSVGLRASTASRPGTPPTPGTILQHRRCAEVGVSWS